MYVFRPSSPTKKEKKEQKIILLYVKALIFAEL